MKLKVVLRRDKSGQGASSYNNLVNAENYKEVALVLLDLKNNSVPIDKAIKELRNLEKSDWDYAIGI
jgi:hypothetical protein